jgi:glycogen debranching enzyme
LLAGLEHSKNATEMSKWKEMTTSITTANEDIYRLFKQSVEDMAGLRLPRSEAENEFVPAAGVPWFVSVFGRDSLIVSLQNMIVYPDFSRGALRILGDLQATEIDDFRDAQPGKILHEIRYGELATLKRIPHTPYYGTADATALYLITLHEAWKWSGDDLLFQQCKGVIDRCLEWIDHYGDLDGDGLQEYQTRSSQGYENMAWKDAHDSVMYPDGTPVRAQRRFVNYRDTHTTPGCEWPMPLTIFTNLSGPAGCGRRPGICSRNLRSDSGAMTLGFMLTLWMGTRSK